MLLISRNIGFEYVTESGFERHCPPQRFARMMRLRTY
jgi:hypothetical protein